MSRQGTDDCHLIQHYEIIKKHNPTVFHAVKLITSWSRVLLDKLRVALLAMNFPSFMEPENKGVPLVLILSHWDPGHTLTPCFFNMHFNITLS
jgi:hypothetical protein